MTIPCRSSAITEILQPGDLIFVSEGGDVLLLAPWLEAGSFEPLESLRLQPLSRGQAAIREFFLTQDFVEVFTPGLVICPGTEPSLDVFSTKLQKGSQSETRYLPTSPELSLKKALSRGLEKIYEIKNCYRNGEVTDHHQPEFLMLEWYRAWENLSSIERDVENLLIHVMGKLGCTDFPKVRRTTMPELFKEHLGVDLRADWQREDYSRLALSQGLRVTEAFTVDDLFFQLFTEKIEPRLRPEVLTFVYDWPPFQAALARIGPSGWAERFEVYWRGLELANAFHELNDPTIQLKRFEEDMAKKRDAGKEVLPLDTDFIKALNQGLPPSAGIALGVERLIMAILKIDHIQSLRAFPY